MQREEDTLKEIPRQIVGSAFDAVNELLSIDRLSIAVYNETTHKLEYTSNPVEDTAVDELPIWRKYMENCFEQQEYISEKGIQTLPLVVDAGKYVSLHRCAVSGTQGRYGAGDRPFAFGTDSPLCLHCNLQCSG